MSLKSILTTWIAGFANGGDNTAAEFRSYQTDLVNEVYPDPIDEYSSAPAYTVPTSDSDYPFFAKFTKQGKMCNIQGYLSNISGVGASNTVVFDFEPTVGGDPNELLPADDIDPETSLPFVFRGTAIRSSDEGTIRILVWDDSGSPKMRVSGAFPSSGTSVTENGKYRFNFNYLVKE